MSCFNLVKQDNPHTPLSSFLKGHFSKCFLIYEGDSVNVHSQATLCRLKWERNRLRTAHTLPHTVQLHSSDTRCPQRYYNHRAGHLLTLSVPSNTAEKTMLIAIIPIRGQTAFTVFYLPSRTSTPRDPHLQEHGFYLRHLRYTLFRPCLADCFVLQPALLFTINLKAIWPADR